MHQSSVGGSGFARRQVNEFWVTAMHHRVGNDGSRRLSADRCLGGDVLHVEEEVLRSGRDGAAKAQALEDENARGKRIVADLTLDRQILSEMVRNKL